MPEIDIKDIENLNCLERRTKNNIPGSKYPNYCAYTDVNNPCLYMREFHDGSEDCFCSYEAFHY
ncbi:MAG: hypothetical protein Q7R52_03500 [archaeon]|nr:hypothetical protein [archaeon]